MGISDKTNNNSWLNKLTTVTTAKFTVKAGEEDLFLEYFMNINARQSWQVIKMEITLSLSEVFYLRSFCRPQAVGPARGEESE